MYASLIDIHGQIQRRDRRHTPLSPVKSQVASICLLRNDGTDPLEKQFEPSGPYGTL